MGTIDFRGIFEGGKLKSGAIGQNVVKTEKWVTVTLPVVTWPFKFFTPPVAPHTSLRHKTAEKNALKKPKFRGEFSNRDFCPDLVVIKID